MEAAAFVPDEPPTESSFGEQDWRVELSALELGGYTTDPE
jgi:hypothetical protein